MTHIIIEVTIRILDKDHHLALSLARRGYHSNDETLPRSYTYFYYSHGECLSVIQAFVNQVINGMSRLVILSIILIYVWRNFLIFYTRDVRSLDYV